MARNLDVITMPSFALLGPIQRIEWGTSRARDFVLSGTPFIISKMALSWPAAQTCAMEALKRRFGHVRVPVRHVDDELEIFFRSAPKEKRNDPRWMMDLATYIDTVTRPPPGTRPPYAGNIGVRSDPAVAAHLRGIIDECRFPDLIANPRGEEIRLWIAAAGQRSVIHNDSYHNFNAQIVGEKRFTVFPPDQHGAIYAEYINIGLWASRVDPRSPDLDKFPDFSSAKGMVAELTPGDVLYLPAFWWHYVEAKTACVNINRWVYTENGGRDYWHQQDEAKRHICYSALLNKVVAEFESRPNELKEIYRPRFLVIRADLDRLAREQTEWANGIENAS